MGERFSRLEELEQRVQMLLRVIAAEGMLPLELKPAQSVGDLLTQHLLRRSSNTVDIFALESASWFGRPPQWKGVSRQFQSATPACTAWSISSVLVHWRLASRQCTLAEDVRGSLQ